MNASSLFKNTQGSNNAVLSLEIETYQLNNIALLSAKLCNQWMI